MLKEFVFRLGNDLEPRHWDMVMKTFSDIFDQTTPRGILQEKAKHYSGEEKPGVEKPVRIKFNQCKGNGSKRRPISHPLHIAAHFNILIERNIGQILRKAFN